MKKVIDSFTKSIVLWAHIKYLKSQKIIEIWNRRIVKPLASERGDVPGWVLITLMTAGLVVVIWAFAAPALQGVFDEAMDRVVKF